MSTGEKETWGDYSKLVLKELERLNDNYERMRNDIGLRFEQMNNVLTNFKATEKLANDHEDWIDEVNNIWSPSQMKEAKDEIYKQKNKWIATIAIITFIQIIIGFILAYWSSKGNSTP